MKKVTSRQRRPVDDEKIVETLKSSLEGALTAHQVAEALGMATAYGVAKVRAHLSKLVDERKIIWTTAENGQGPGRLPRLYRAR